MTSEYNWDALADPFSPEVVKQRKGPGGKTLDYIDARDVMDRLDEIIGPAHWQDNYAPGPAGGVLCTLSIWIDGIWVSKSDVGENTDIEAVKGGCSDAFKRAAVKWGIGRHLYQDKPTRKKGAQKAPPPPDKSPISERKELITRIAKTWYGDNEQNALDYLKKLYETKVDGQRVIHAEMDDTVVWKIVAQWVWPDALPGQMLLKGLAKHPEHAYNRLNKMCQDGRIGITDNIESILAEVELYQAEKTHNDNPS